jgi:NAD(P)H-nitrite reductase large subunit
MTAAALTVVAIAERGGVMVDISCATSAPHVFAVGEVAAVEGRCYGLVAPGYTMAEVVADRLLGGTAEFPGADVSTNLKLLDVDVASFGDAHASTPGALVKSCVGSTWCRYGVQDSVAMAVNLELRYRGLRSPHKIKMGVSGCQRECAEARGKDIGVIATEKGWNLYVGGNGGANPKHAQLLAGDLDSDTLVRYIDRYLLFYIRTADRLQRIPVWQETIEGGLDHIRGVVCEDSLGIAADLDAAMTSGPA